MEGGREGGRVGGREGDDEPLYDSQDSQKTEVGCGGRREISID